MTWAVSYVSKHYVRDGVGYYNGHLSILAGHLE